MNTYTIYLGAKPIACVDTDGAYPCFEAAKTIAEFTGTDATLRLRTTTPRIRRRAANLIGVNPTPTTATTK